MADLHLLSPFGFRASGVYAGLKTRQFPDVGLLLNEGPSPTAAAVFTTNKVFAAPIKVGREHMAESGGRLRAVVVNAGNANACTGRQGEKDARRMCQLAAAVAGCEDWEVLPSSTGIIGHLLPMEKVERGIREAGEFLGSSLEHALRFADAILTTDLKRKSAAVELKFGKERVTIAGVCKGSGMIGPNLSPEGPAPSAGATAPGRRTSAKKASRPKRGGHATMLAYLTTDAAAPAGELRKLLAAASDGSFNAVTVDGHTSTNDTAALLASGATARLDTAQRRAAFAAALLEVCQSLAYQIAADGEGATKVVDIRIDNATSDADANAIARAIANSPLVKCAMHGSDPNWGRIVSAAGLAGVPFNPDRCTLRLQGTLVFKDGRPVPFDDAKVSASMNAPEVKILVDCRTGSGTGRCLTCDLSKDYVTINADYHT
jgi:glutamate N-acetyltransferase/amino-acid N-acetyltransferase